MPCRARALTATVLLLAACSADPSGPGPIGPAPPPPGSTDLQMAASIDGHAYLVTVPEGFPVSLIEVNKGGILLSATFHDRGGRASAINAVEYQLTVTGSPDGAPLPSGVDFTRTDAFSGSLYWLAPGQEVDLWIGLFRIPTGEHVLGPYSVAVQRRAHEPVEEPAP